MYDVLIYTPGNSGTGYLRRMFRVSEALAQNNFKVLCVFGVGMSIPDFITNGISHRIFLPRMTFDRVNVSFGNAYLQPIYSNLIRDCLINFRPKIFISSHHAGVSQELIPILKERNLWKKTKRILAWRDVLKSPETIESWKEIKSLRFISTIEKDFDEVWVFGQKDIIDCGELFSFPKTISTKIKYLGYVSPQNLERFSNSQRATNRVMISFGGGENRDYLFNKLLPKLIIVLKRLGIATIIFAGKYWTEDCNNILNNICMNSENITIFPFSDSDTYMTCLSTCSLTINAGGYNSIIEALSLHTPLLVMEGNHSSNQVGEVQTRNKYFLQKKVYDVLLESMSEDEIEEKIQYSLNNKNANSLIKFDGINNVIKEVKTMLLNN